jgi:Na+-driven multidrug efflux pump
MSVWGWWAFDIFTLIASYLHAVVIAAQTILRSIGLITFMLPVGIMTACVTLIGNAIGEGR